MARMIGKTLRIRQCPYECCGDTMDKHSVKIREKRAWLEEAELELYDERDEKHKNGICYNPPGYGCDDCYNNDDYYDASELDGIPGVWTDAERLIP